MSHVWQMYPPKYDSVIAFTVCGCMYATHSSWLTCEPNMNQDPPFSHSHLHSLSPPCFTFGRSQSKVNFGRDALLCRCHSMLLSTPFPLLSSLLRSHSSPPGLTSLLATDSPWIKHGKHILRLTGCCEEETSRRHHATTLSHHSCLSHVLGWVGEFIKWC